MEARWFVTMIMVAALPLCAGEAATAATTVGMVGNWPGFRGPGGCGVAAPGTFPLHWSGASGKNILWSVKLEKAGYNSPVVWGDKVLLCGGDEKELAVYCHQAETGKLLWKGVVPPIARRAGQKLPELREDTGFATPTMATDGTAVFALFWNGDFVAFDMAGQLRWAQSLVLSDNSYGQSSSLIAHDGRIFVQADAAGGGAVEAFDTNTGKSLWRTVRDMPSWSSPILVDSGKRLELILSATPSVVAYDPVGGKELWRMDCLGGELATSPAFSAGTLFVAQEGSALTAIGMDDKPQARWESQDNLPDIASPVASEQLLYNCTSGGSVICRDALKGGTLWEKSFAGITFWASPVIAGGHVYVLARDGTMHIFKLGRELVELDACALGEGAIATPAFANGCIYIRGETRLYCIKE